MNERTQSKKFRLLLDYAWLPMASIVVAHAIVYYGTKLINGNMTHYCLALPFEDKIPIAPEWVLIYVLTFLFWVGGLMFTAWQERELCCRLCAGAIVGYFICAVFFLAVPTAIERPEVVGDMYYHDLLRAIYGADIPTNIFPSMHCMMSYMIFRGLSVNPNVKKGYSVAACVLTLLISASTVLIRQHYIVDAVSGLLLAEVSMQIGLRTQLWQLLDGLNKKLLHC